VTQEAQPLYANAFQAAIGPFDITLDFGYKSPEQAQTDSFDRVARVSMSLSHAKAMVQILGELIGKYELEVGAVPVPSQVNEDQGKKQ
jgi:hypothetical protein